MENRRSDKDDAWLLTHPREMCKHCWKWCESSGKSWDAISGCAADTGVTGNDYLLGRTDYCSYFF